MATRGSIAKDTRATGAKAGGRGTAGAAVPSGTRGPAGAAGPPGPAGARGVQGPAGPKINRADVLAMVEDQFTEIRKEMRLQLARMAQIQAQLDQIHTMIRKLVTDGSQ